MSVKLKEWKNNHPACAWDDLSKETGISVGYLNQLAYGNRGLTSKKAEIIANATKTIDSKNFLDKSEIIFCDKK